MAPSGKRKPTSEMLKSKIKKVKKNLTISSKNVDTKVKKGDRVTAKKTEVSNSLQIDDKRQSSNANDKPQVKKNLNSSTDDMQSSKTQKRANSNIGGNSNIVLNKSSILSENGKTLQQSRNAKTINVMDTVCSLNLRHEKSENNITRKVKEKKNSGVSKDVWLKSSEKKYTKRSTPVIKDSSVKKKVKPNVSHENEKTRNIMNSVKVMKSTASKGKLSSTETAVLVSANNSSSSEDEWEEVPDGELEPSLDDYKPELPEGGVEITLERPNLDKRRQRKVFDMMDYIRLQMNRMKKENQLAVHQVHLLCLIAHGRYLNSVLNSDDIKAYALSLLPLDFFSVLKKNPMLDLDVIKDFVSWFTSIFKVVEKRFPFSRYIKNSLFIAFENQTASSISEYNLLFIGVARTLGMNVRLCMSLYPLSFRPTGLLKKQKQDETETVKEDKKMHTNQKNSNASGSKSNKSTKKIKSADKSCKGSKNQIKSLKSDFNCKEEKLPDLPSNRLKRSNVKASYKASSDENTDDDDDFVPQSENNLLRRRPSIQMTYTPTNTNKKVTAFTKGIQIKRNKEILSSYSESSIIDKGVEHWVEIYSRAKEKWICVECNNKIVNKPLDIESVAVQPISYVLAFDSKSHVKDVTKRYCAKWMTHTRKLRVEPDWWEDTLEPFLPPNNKLNRTENSELEISLLIKPIPKTISEFKNHPLYVLKRHLLKFEAIYPPDALTVGFIRGEAVYSRDCVHTLHSRENWIKEARMVRIGEKPYKIVKARPKWDKFACVIKTDLPLEVFGHWQTEKYMPPIAHNGKVPRNEYGNVELFKPCMLPIGTIHLRIPCLNRIAKKLDIDCSSAVVGFDGHRGSIHPVFDGFIVCEEFKDTLLAAWEEEQVNAKKREEEKRLKRVYGNWKKLIKGLLIRERIKRRYLSKD